MKILFSSTIPHHHSEEVMNERNTNFINEMNTIAEKYRQAGHIFEPHITLPIQHEMGADTATMFEFPEGSGIPKEMQEEIATAWGNLWEH